MVKKPSKEGRKHVLTLNVIGAVGLYMMLVGGTFLLMIPMSLPRDLAIQLSSLTLCMLLALIGFVFFQSSRSISEVRDSYRRAVCYIGRQYPGENEGGTLFGDVLVTGGISLGALLLAIPVMWLVHRTNVYFIWGIILLFVGLSIRFVRKRSGWIAIPLIYLPVMLLVSAGDYYVSMLGACFIFAAISWVEVKRHHVQSANREHRTWLDRRALRVCAYIRNLTRTVHETIFARHNMHTFQALIIVATLVVFVFGPPLMQYAPPGLQSALGGYPGRVLQNSAYVSYMAYICYAGMSLTYVYSFIVEFVAVNGRSRLWAIANWGAAMLIALPFMPFLIMFSLVANVLILEVGHTFLGANFAVLVGFFVFPAWMTRLYSAILALGLLTLSPKFIEHRLAFFDLRDRS